MRWRTKIIAAAVLALCGGAACAEPISAGAALISMATAGTTMAWVGWAAMGLAMIYNSSEARSQKRAMAAAAKAQAISQLQTRTITALQGDPPWQVIYGEATVGGFVHAIVTHDKTARREDGTVYTRPDSYKSLVIRWADHQCKGVKSILINGIDIGAVDANGWVTGGAYYSTGTKATRTASFTGSITLPEAVIDVLGCYRNVVSIGEGLTDATVVPYTLSNGNKTVTVTDGGACTFDYTVGNLNARVRVEHYRGTATQAASAYLIAQSGGTWTAAHQLKGKCYSVITLDLEDPKFQGGFGEIMAVVEGHDQILDTRTSTTGYSQNNALCTNNWLRSPWGYSVTASDVDTARLNAAANACDVSTTYTEGTTSITGPRYTCNGAFRTDTGKEQALLDLAESMAGHVAYGGMWLIDAGAWVAPLMTLTDADTAGPCEIVQMGAPEGEIFNGVRGQYLPAATHAVADFEPYQNATFLTADGGVPKWDNLVLPYTSTKARCRQIARVMTERSRDGMVIKLPVKRRAWPLQAGDRVAINNTEMGWAGKTWRITDLSLAPQQRMLLTLQEDHAAIYDTADATVADPAPNTGLQSPFVVLPMPTLSVASGTAHLLRMADGTIVPRVRVSWAAITDPYVLAGGKVEARWRNVGSSTWESWTQAMGSDLGVYLSGPSERMPIVIEARPVNALGYLGGSNFAAHVVVGKTAPPANVAGLTASVSGGQARISCTPNAEVDYGETEFRIGATWAGGTTLFRGAAQSAPWAPYPVAGTYTVWATHYDTTGNASTPVSIAVSVSAVGAIFVGGNVLPNADFSGYTGGNNGIADGWSLYTSGAVVSPYYGWQATDSVDGGAWQYIAGNIGATATDRIGISTAVSAPMPLLAGGPVVMSGHIKYPANCGALIYYEFKNAVGDLLAANNRAIPAGNGAWQRFEVFDTAPVNTQSAIVYVWFHGAGSPVALSAGIDKLSLSPGDSSLPFAPKAGEIVNGAVDTPQLATDAATETYQDNYDFAGASYSGFATARTFVVTPTANCTVEFAAKITAANIYPDAGNQVWWQVTPTAGATVILGGAEYTGVSGIKQESNVGAFFSAAAFVPLTFEIKVRKSGGSNPTLYNSSLKLGLIKR